MNRKALALLLSGALCLTLAAGCSSDGGGNAAKDSTPPSAAQQTPSAAPSPSGDPAPVETPDAAPGDTLESSGTLGDYGVEIKDFALAKDYTGASAIVITYTFTNNSEEAAAAMVALSEIAYQNGLQLDAAVIADSSWRSRRAAPSTFKRPTFWSAKPRRSALRSASCSASPAISWARPLKSQRAASPSWPPSMCPPTP